MHGFYLFLAHFGQLSNFSKLPVQFWKIWFKPGIERLLGVCMYVCIHIYQGEIVQYRPRFYDKTSLILIAAMPSWQYRIRFFGALACVR